MSTWTDETHEEARSIGFGFSFYEPGISELVADAVTEIERLRAERPVITDSLVETALNAWFHDEPDGVYEGFPDDTTARMRAALEAAFGPTS